MAGVQPCWGIDLSGSPWPLAEFGAEREPAWIPGPDLIAETEGLLRPSATDDPIRPVLNDWAELREPLRRFREPVRLGLPDRGLIGVAHPRSAPPALRQLLPILFGEEAATPGGGLPSESRLIGVEAPVALLLEAVASGAVAPSGAFVVGCGSAPSREWTALAIAAEPATEGGNGRPTLRITLGPSSNSLDDGLRLDRQTILMAGEPGGESFDGEVVRLDLAATARGAARFAEWLALELSRRPTTIDRRRQAALLPAAPVLADRLTHPIGLIGGDARGGWYWRRLFDAGRTIPTGNVGLLSATAPPCWILLAECLNPRNHSSRWLTREEWPDAGLRWHSAFHQTIQAGAAPPLRWVMELRDFNDRRAAADGPWNGVPPRWGLPNWVCRVVAEAPS